MNYHTLAALGQMAKHGGNYFGQLHVEGLQQQRIKEAREEAERVYTRNRSDQKTDIADNREYQEGREEVKRGEKVEDRDANYSAELNQRKTLLEMEAQFKKENPQFKSLEKGVDADGKDVYYKLYSDGRTEPTDIGVSYAGDPTMASNKHIDNVRKEVNSQLKDVKIQEASESVQKMAHAYKGKNAMSDAAMIFYFMKTLDPTSVVRESEFRTVEQARGFMTEYEKSGKRIPAFMGQFMQKMDSGALLLPEQREQILDETINAYNAKVDVVTNTTKTYSKIAEDRDWDRESLGLTRWDTFKKESRESLIGAKDKAPTSSSHPDDITEILNRNKP